MNNEMETVINCSCILVGDACIFLNGRKGGGPALAVVAGSSGYRHVFPFRKCSSLAAIDRDGCGFSPISAATLHVQIRCFVLLKT